MFLYFPTNYTWSLAVLRCLMSGGSFGDVAWACAGLQEAARKGPRGDAPAWTAAWTRLASQTEETAEAAFEAGHHVTARGAYYRAAQYFQWAEAFSGPTDSQSKSLYQRHLSTFAKFAELSQPRIEIIDIPFDGASLKAYFAPAEGVTGPAPTVILSDGLDGTKEEMFPIARAFAMRGISCLAVDGPGQGATLRMSGLVARHDSEVATGVVVDYLEKRSDVDSNRIGIIAASLGGYYAPRAVAFEKRIKACVAWSVIYDYHEVWKRRLNFESGRPLNVADGAALGTTEHHLLHILGVKDFDAAMAKLEKFRLEPVARQIDCDFLIVHGAEDRQAPLAEAQRLYESISSKNKDMWVYTLADGGSGHVQVDRPEPALNRIADWMAVRLNVAK
ncbi:2,6-dihydropseudooxynicotine hydrolase [compost metagenome]|uniref:alpha/beta hydrolase family protein n=1 Tax=Variovorax boronicumulans TaxID=436515 RepID=UPI000BB38FE9|nr:alpha/beta hydrolase [Variovorax boronicumulans]PBI95853.1 2,6-dihydropseudooxynicotine hydrolase [Variovorax boronicumulans]